SLFLIIFFSLVSIPGFFYMSQQNLCLKSSIQRLETDITKLGAVKIDSVVYRQWADTVIFKRLNFEDHLGTGSGTKSDTVLEGEIKEADRTAAEPLLAIEDFDVTRINLSLDFNCSLKLINKSSNNKKLSGYLFLVASNTDAAPALFDSCPPVKLINGMPEDYAQGSTFDIRSMKYIKGRINQQDIGSKFNRLDVLAYSKEGTLLLKKGFYIEGSLQAGSFE
ncbi:MAG: hypothetical protein WCQ99_11365, partial [Pseudomonadota bacterium]